MKKLLLIITFGLCALGLCAQDLEFLGIPLTKTTKEAVGKALLEKSFVVIKEQDGAIGYRGPFKGREALVILGLAGSTNGNMAVTVNGTDVDEMKEFSSALLDEMKAEYPNAKTFTETKVNGATVTFMISSKDGSVGVIQFEYGNFGPEYKLDLTFMPDFKL